jgi:hypothetical protein
MKFHSPLSIEVCREILNDQVQKRTWFRKINILKRPTSHIIGIIKEDHIKLSSSIDRYSKKFIGKLSASNDGTILAGYWKTGFWSHIYGSPQFDENELIAFLLKWGKFKRIA